MPTLIILDYGGVKKNFNTQFWIFFKVICLRMTYVQKESQSLQEMKIEKDQKEGQN